FYSLDKRLVGPVGLPSHLNLALTRSPLLTTLCAQGDHTRSSTYFLLRPASSARNLDLLARAPPRQESLFEPLFFLTILHFDRVFLIFFKFWFYTTHARYQNSVEFLFVF